jgi:hypothetical protein
MALLLLPQCGDLGERDARIGLLSGGQGVFKRPASPAYGRRRDTEKRQAARAISGPRSLSASLPRPSLTIPSSLAVNVGFAPRVSIRKPTVSLIFEEGRRVGEQVTTPALGRRHLAPGWQELHGRTRSPAPPARHLIECASCCCQGRRRPARAALSFSHRVVKGRGRKGQTAVYW